MARTTKRQLHAPPERTELHFRPADWMRSYQRGVLAAMLARRGQRAMTVWHRKAGKDWTWLRIANALMTQRPGLYVHCFPTLKQGREIIWDGIDVQGRKFLDIFEPERVKDKSESEMMLELKPGAGQSTGSIYQIMGTDNIQKRRGPNAVGVVLSEYQDMPEGTFEEIFEPMVLSNGGWAGFCFTPRGKNHAYRLWNSAQQDPAWFTDLRTILATAKDAPGEDGSPIVTMAHIADLRKRGVREEIIQQEYFCSFDGFLLGTIFGDLLGQARADGRIGRVVRDVQHPVGVCFDFGGDGTAMIFYQTYGKEIRFIDYVSFQGKDSSHAVKILHEKPYVYGQIILPWDAKQRKAWTPSKTVEEYLTDNFPGRVVTLEKLGILETVDMTRRLFSRFVFDATACQREQPDGMPSLLESIGNYRYPWNDRLQEFGAVPVHDKTSHGGSALRYGGQHGFPMLELWDESVLETRREVACPWLHAPVARERAWR